MKARYLFIAAAVTLAAGVWQLAGNARQASLMRDQILAKDQASQDPTADLAALKLFSSTHMSAATRVELTASYQRDLTAAETAAQPSGQIYASAQKACASKADSITQARCVTDYVSKNLKPTGISAVMPDQAKYVYDFKSPVWTPDAAGALMLGSAGLFGLGLFTVLRRKQRRIL
ncbi:MAG TPA: hypothetical protein VLF41_02440 [Candidatus Nanoarchaeia archaeon]|nr:hypothetical protein [Candidatus Nanoarchaeia archaeon]